MIYASRGAAGTIFSILCFLCFFHDAVLCSKCVFSMIWRFLGFLLNAGTPFSQTWSVVTKTRHNYPLTFYLWGSPGLRMGSGTPNLQTGYFLWRSPPYRSADGRRLSRIQPGILLVVFFDFERPLLEFPPTDLHENLRKWSVSSALSRGSIKTRIRALFGKRSGKKRRKNTCVLMIFRCFWPKLAPKTS